MPITLALQVRRRPPKSVLVKAAAQMAAVAVNQAFVRVRNAHAIAALKTRKNVEQIAAQKRLKPRLSLLKCLHAARDAARSKEFGEHNLENEIISDIGIDWKPTKKYAYELGERYWFREF